MKIYKIQIIQPKFNKLYNKYKNIYLSNSSNSSVSMSGSGRGKVFIIHGHENKLKEEVKKLLEESGFTPIILHDEPNKGQTIIEKLERSSKKVGFAVAVLTPDDLGKNKNGQKYNYRARQNVILEVGYFMGLLGRDKVCMIYKKDIELSSDMDGILYISHDKNGNWEKKLIKEIESARPITK